MQHRLGNTTNSKVVWVVSKLVSLAQTLDNYMQIKVEERNIWTPLASCNIVYKIQIRLIFLIPIFMNKPRSTKH